MAAGSTIGGRRGAVVWPSEGWVEVTRRDRRRDESDRSKAAVEARLAALAVAAGVPRTPKPPPSLEREYVQARLRALEAAVDALTRQRDDDEAGGR